MQRKVTEVEIVADKKKSMKVEINELKKERKQA